MLANKFYILLLFFLFFINVIFICVIFQLYWKCRTLYTYNGNPYPGNIVYRDKLINRTYFKYYVNTSNINTIELKEA